MKKILTVTMNPSLDKSSHVERAVPGRKLRCLQPRFEPGGGGINVSRAIGKLGGSSVAVFPVGGLAGRHLLQLLEEEKIDRLPFHINGRTRENFTVFEQSGAQQWRFVMPGPEMDRHEYEKAMENIRGLGPETDFAVLSGSLPPGAPVDFYGKIARAISEQGVRIILDSSGSALRGGMAGGVHLIKPNLLELRQLVGKDLESEGEQIEAAQGIIESFSVETVVVSLGGSGVLMVSQGEHRFLRSPTVTRRSRIGAGDSMVAGMVMSLAMDRSLLESVKFGIAAGASAVMTEGTELCRRDTTEELYRCYEP
jgi:6-phosphofructokinase 2